MKLIFSDRSCSHSNTYSNLQILVKTGFSTQSWITGPVPESYRGRTVRNRPVPESCQGGTEVHQVVNLPAAVVKTFLQGQLVARGSRRGKCAATEPVRCDSNGWGLAARGECSVRKKQRSLAHDWLADLCHLAYQLRAWCPPAGGGVIVSVSAEGAGARKGLG